MKETEKRGPAACNPCGRVCIAAFTLALLSFLPSCTNGTDDDGTARDTPAYQQPAQKPAAAPGAAAPTEEAVIAPPSDEEATETADSTGAEAVPGGTDSPALEESQVSPGIRTLGQAETGDIVLAGGEILSPGYLAGRTDGGLKPVGIICPGDKGRKMLVVLDSFFEEKEEYGWGRLYGKKSKLEGVAVSMPRGAPNPVKMGGAPIKTNTKENSIGNGRIIRSQTERGTAFTEYISSCGKKYACAIGSLQWEVPTVFELTEIYANRSVLQKSKAALAQYFRNTGDERAAQLEGPALISREKHILTSNSGYGSWNDKDVPGIWAFREAEDGFSEAESNIFVGIIDENSQPVYVYKYVVTDKDSGETYPIEGILARGSKISFSTMAVAYLE